NCFIDAALILPSGVEPETFEKAIDSEDVDLWIQAMRDEMRSILRNRTWTLIAPPQHMAPIGVRWVFKIKRVNGRIRYKARLVALGYAQREGVDYAETYSPVIQATTIRLLLSVAASLDHEMVQFDVSTAFLNGTIEEEIYLRQPPGFNDGSGRVCR